LSFFAIAGWPRAFIQGTNFGKKSTARRLARRREEATRIAAGGAAQLLQDPVVVSTGLEVLRALGSRKATPIAAVVLAGVLIAASRFNAKSKPSQSGSKTGN
jgi:hypothetical protein